MAQVPSTRQLSEKGQKSLKAELINFFGKNTTQMQSDSSAFTAFRSSMVITFTGSDGTVLKIPATKDVQTISFKCEESRVVLIHNNQAKLEDRDIITSAAVLDQSIIENNYGNLGFSPIDNMVSP